MIATPRRQSMQYSVLCTGSGLTYLTTMITDSSSPFARSGKLRSSIIPLISPTILGHTDPNPSSPYHPSSPSQQSVINQPAICSNHLYIRFYTASYPSSTIAINLLSTNYQFVRNQLAIRQEPVSNPVYQPFCNKLSPSLESIVNHLTIYYQPVTIHYQQSKLSACNLYSTFSANVTYYAIIFNQYAINYKSARNLLSAISK